MLFINKFPSQTLGMILLPQKSPVFVWRLLHSRTNIFGKVPWQ